MLASGFSVTRVFSGFQALDQRAEAAMSVD
jgi:hypothetical protein